MAYYNFFLFCFVIYFCTCLTLDTKTSFKRLRAYNYAAGRGSNTTDKETRNFERNKLVIKVFYETLCPASVDFFISQLQPTVKSIGSHIKVLMVPYGNAETRRVRGLHIFRCQHGPAECYGNKLHACAIDAIKNNTKAVFYNTCLMKYSVKGEDSTIDFTTALNWCGYKYSVPIRTVWQCARSRRGTRLLKIYGEQSEKAGLRYVPFVLLDGSSDKQDEATVDLMSTVCKMLKPTPPACNNHNMVKTFH